MSPAQDSDVSEHVSIGVSSALFFMIKFSKVPVPAAVPFFMAGFLHSVCLLTFSHDLPDLVSKRSCNVQYN